jgi:hypothetical protein
VPPEGAERAALAVAAGQRGVVTARQLAGCGLTRHDVARRLRRGWLRRRYRGVFIVGPVDAPQAAAMAAVLALGDRALLSHEAAAVLWGTRVPAGGAIDVTVVGRDARGPAEVRVDRTQALHPADATRDHGIPVTSPERTLLDLATVLAPTALARAVEDALVQRLVTIHSLNEQFRRYPHHRGVRALRQAARPDPAHTRSEAERRVLELIRADLQAAGYLVLRVTWTQIVDEPAALVASLALAYGRRSRGPR